MAGDKKITDLNRATPLGSFDFISATGSDNYKVSYSNLAEYSSINVQSGTFTESLTISGVAVSTGVAPPSTEGLIKWSDAPASSTSPGSTGDVAFDEDYFYLNAPNTGVKVVSVAGSKFSTLFLNEQGDVYGCGKVYGLGPAFDSSTPLRITGDVTGIFSSVESMFFLKKNWEVHGCGKNETGQLGLGVTGYSIGPNSSVGVVDYPTRITGDVSKVAGGSIHSLFLKSNGDVHTAGGNTNGQLGMGYSGDDNPNFYPTKITGDCIDVGATYRSSLFVKSNGDAYGCGSNTSEQLGQGPQGPSVFESYSLPIVMSGGGVSSIYGIDSSVFLLRSDNELYGCGANSYGQLGIGNDTRQTYFQHISGNTTGFGGNFNSSSVITTDGDLYGFGFGSNYQFGIKEDAEHLLSPTYLRSSITGSAMSWENSTFITFTGDVLSAGDNSKGECGVGNTQTQKYSTLSTGTTTYESSWRRTPISTW